MKELILAITISFLLMLASMVGLGVVLKLVLTMLTGALKVAICFIATIWIFDIIQNW